MNPHLSEDTLHRNAMENGSQELFRAIREALRGRNPGTYNGIIWGRQSQAGQYGPPPELRSEPLYVKRDPCPKCGTRADMGCKHRRVA